MSRTNSSKLSRPITETNPRSAISEAYRTLRSNTESFFDEQRLKVILVTSSDPTEDKNHVALNFAVVQAQTGKSVLLIDADIRNPNLHRCYDLDNNLGLCNVLLNECKLEECVKQSEYTPNLVLLPSGKVNEDVPSLFGSHKFDEFLALARQEYDAIIIESPSVMSTVDSLDLSRKSDGVLLIVDAKRSSRAIIKQSVERLNLVGANILGVVLNRVRKRNPKQDFYTVRNTSSASLKA